MPPEAPVYIYVRDKCHVNIHGSSSLYASRLFVRINNKVSPFIGYGINQIHHSTAQHSTFFLFLGEPNHSQAGRQAGRQAVRAWRARRGLPSLPLFRAEGVQMDALGTKDSTSVHGPDPCPKGNE